MLTRVMVQRYRSRSKSTALQFHNHCWQNAVNRNASSRNDGVDGILDLAVIDKER